MKSWQLVAAGFAAGVLLTTGAAYILLEPVTKFWSHAPYIQAASDAILNLKTLENLSAGDVAAANRIVEGQLRLNETTLQTYVSEFSQDELEPRVLEARAAILDYRQRNHSP